ncbi:MAG: hypothetical protein AB7S26_34740 [Sandaracinaceae bacterium]
MRRWIRISMAGAAAIAGVVTLAAIWLTPSEAECADPALCRPQQTRLDDHGFFRALSLDIRGRVPTVEEYARMESEGYEAQLDEWLTGEDFAQRVVRRHRALLWPNIENQTRLYHFRRGLANAAVETGGARIWHQNNQQTREAYRGISTGGDGYDGAFGCVDEPAIITGGVIQTNADGREGWVMVAPYWDMANPIQVCAFDAQENRFSPSGNDCATPASVGDPGCGCGPNLRWCVDGTARTQVLRAFTDEMDQRVAAHVLADEPYYELLTSRRAFLNGPLAHFWRHHAQTPQGVTLMPVAVDLETLPPAGVDDATRGIPWQATDEWTEIELPEEHSGLLTHPAYLLRFQTNRARANRFYDAFLCQPFQPPEGGIPLDDEVAAAQPDVQQRPGCAYCHAILEPGAAHWGRWTQQGGGFLDEALYPEFRQECYDCGRGLEPCSTLCRNNYVTRALSPEEMPNLGRLRAFEFLRDADRPNVDAGPAALVRQGLADGRFTACAVSHTAQWLLDRPLDAEEQQWARELTTDFLGSDFRYRELVKAIVTSDTYRRAL